MKWKWRLTPFVVGNYGARPLLNTEQGFERLK
jgi:hypothetical protein